MRSAPFSLTPFEISVGSRRTTLAGREYVRIHPQAHRTAGLTPIKPRVAKNAIESLRFRLPLYLATSGTNHRMHTVRHAISFHFCRSRAKLLNATIRTRSNEAAVNRERGQRLTTR